MLAVIPQDPPQLRDSLIDRALRHHDVRPDLIEQFLYVNDPSGVRCEIEQ